jgi:hypothetical protein
MVISACITEPLVLVHRGFFHPHRNLVVSFMDGFSGYNQIQIKPKDQHKTAFICLWVTFAYQKMSFGLKNVGATFQWAMYFSF